MISIDTTPDHERFRTALVRAGADPTVSVRIDDDFFGIRMRGHEPMVRLRWNPDRQFEMYFPVDELRERLDFGDIVRRMKEGEESAIPWERYVCDS